MHTYVPYYIQTSATIPCYIKAPLRPPVAAPDLPICWYSICIDYVYIYIYIHTTMIMCIYIYIYIHICIPTKIR